MTTCPHCKKKSLRAVSTVGLPSNLVRTETSGFIEGQTCWNCGKWVEQDIEVMPIPKSLMKHDNYRFKEFCKRGHARTEENITKRGACRECQRITDAARTLDPMYKAYQKAYRGKAIDAPKGIKYGEGF